MTGKLQALIYSDNPCRTAKHQIDKGRPAYKTAKKDATALL
ncbi:hypothetical protein [Saccharophagus sp. K07]|jgi:hypothetical protein|nr:hypothetical protein [Saccharophagus sp. K07]